jgi:excisionase family DNA binding protein
MHVNIEDRWMTSREAAEYLGYSDYTLKRARVDKMLSGKEQPKFTKSGKAVRYKMSDLDAWMNGEPV